MVKDNIYIYRSETQRDGINWTVVDYTKHRQWSLYTPEMQIMAEIPEGTKYQLKYLDADGPTVPVIATITILQKVIGDHSLEKLTLHFPNGSKKELSPGT